MFTRKGFITDILTLIFQEKNFDRNRVQGMGRDGCDNLQTCAMNEHSPLPQPKTGGVTTATASTVVVKETKAKTRSRDLSARYSDVKLE